jgi:hypothetical protein
MDGSAARPAKFNPWTLLLPWVFVQRLIGATKYVRARSLSRDGRDEEALRIMRSMPESMKTRRVWRVFEIQLLSLLGWHNETIERANAYILAEFNRDAGDADQQYLLAFVKWRAQHAFARIADDSPMPTSFAFDYVWVNLQHVRDYLKRAFPLRGHPSWNDE